MSQADLKPEDLKKIEKCRLKFEGGKAIIECPDAESVALVTSIVVKGVQIVQKTPKEEKEVRKK
jgi:hypothetical protein